MIVILIIIMIVILIIMMMVRLTVLKLKPPTSPRAWAQHVVRASWGWDYHHDTAEETDADKVDTIDEQNMCDNNDKTGEAADWWTLPRGDPCKGLTR